MILPLLALLTVAFVAWSLHDRGRPWHRNAYSQRWIDGWAMTHFGHGLVLFGLVKMTFPWPTADLISVVIILEALWESLENRNWMIRKFRSGGDKDYFGDSIANSSIDLLACILGALTMIFFI